MGVADFALAKIPDSLMMSHFPQNREKGSFSAKVQEASQRICKEKQQQQQQGDKDETEIQASFSTAG